MARKKKRSAWGSVIFRADRGWYAVRVPVDEKPGKYRIYRQESKAAAEAKLKQLRGLHEAGRLLVREKDAPEPGKTKAALTLLAAINEYIAGKQGEAAVKTLESYRGIRNVIGSEDSPLRDVAVATLEAGDVEVYRAWRREHIFRVIAPPVPGVEPRMEHRPGVVASNATINRDVTLIKSALNRLVRLKRLAENPVAVVKAGKERQKLPVALSDEEAGRLLAASGDEFRPVVMTALYTGARKEEVLGLTWGAVDLAEEAVSVSRDKTGNATRIPVAPALIEELKRLRGDRIPPASERVFSVKDIRSAWRRAVKAAELDGKQGFTFHGTRHTFATKYLSDGGNVYELKEVLGHANLATTMKYLHLVDERVRRTMTGLSYGAAPAGQIRTHERTQSGNSEKVAREGIA